MATYTIRGTSHNVVYTYKAADGKRKQQWESYSSELEAIQRKAYIDYLQSQNRASDITHEASEYRRKKAVEKVAQKIAAENAVATPDTPSPESEDNMSKTYREFMERFLPIHARKKNFSPKTYDSYRQNLETHIYPYGITLEQMKQYFIKHQHAREIGDKKMMEKIEYHLTYINFHYECGLLVTGQYDTRGRITPPSCIGVTGRISAISLRLY